MGVTGPRVWRIRLDRPHEGSRWWRTLSGAEQERARQIASPHEQHRFIVAHAALRSVLGRMCGVRASRLRFGAEDGGRPYLMLPGAPDFNLSHSGDWALVAVAPKGSRVGVDVERIRADLDCLAMAGSMYQPEEVERLRREGPDARHAAYFRLWTAKEACVKAAGVGLAGLRDVLVTEESPARGSVRLATTATPWPVRWLAIAPGYAAALVTAPT